LNIYIGGDSFCADRQDWVTTWPVILAKKLNLNLAGSGFAGKGFWSTRLDLIEYLKDEDNSKNTDLFVFCHTSEDRMLHTEYARDLVGVDWRGAPSNPFNNREVVEMYYKYLYDPEIHTWAMKQWFIELNEILANKTVIHMFCFESTASLSPILNGHKLYENLYLVAYNMDGLDNEDVYVERFNHFTQSFNDKFANALANYYLTEVMQNPTQTKYFNIDI